MGRNRKGGSRRLRLEVDPRHYEVPVPRGVLPKGREAVRHGWHSADAVEIPTSLNCSTCVLYHLKKKDRRHPLACPEGRKNQVCTILLALQERWVEGLVGEVRQITGGDPSPSDNARIEQIVRHRSRIFQCENYLKVAGLVDLAKGEVRNVADRLTTTENALSRSLTEFRQAMADRRQQNSANAPSLEEYLELLREAKEVGGAVEGDGEIEAEVEGETDGNTASELVGSGTAPEHDLEVQTDPTNPGQEDRS